jgi:hypothetical protein
VLQLYSNLLLLNSCDTKDVLDFDVLLLAITSEKGMARLFRPDAKQKVKQFTFVQSYDAVYIGLKHWNLGPAVFVAISSDELLSPNCSLLVLEQNHRMSGLLKITLAQRTVTENI